MALLQFSVILSFVFAAAEEVTSLLSDPAVILPSMMVMDFTIWNSKTAINYFFYKVMVSLQINKK